MQHLPIICFIHVTLLFSYPVIIFDKFLVKDYPSGLIRSYIILPYINIICKKKTHLMSLKDISPHFIHCKQIQRVFLSAVSKSVPRESVLFKAILVSVFS